MNLVRRVCNFYSRIWKYIQYFKRNQISTPNFWSCWLQKVQRLQF